MKNIAKKSWSLLLVLCLLAGVMAGCGNESDGSSEPANGSSVSGAQSEDQPSSERIRVTVDCSAAVDGGYTVPGGKAQMLDAELDLQEKSTVLSTLQDACKEAGLDVTLGSGSYVQGIGGLSEKDCGPTSGWTYTVNGEMVMVGAAECELKAGDQVQWTYILSWE